jgi:hypothetical protein
MTKNEERQSGTMVMLGLAALLCWALVILNGQRKPLERERLIEDASASYPEVNVWTLFQQALRFIDEFPKDDFEVPLGRVHCVRESIFDQTFSNVTLVVWKPGLTISNCTLQIAENEYGIFIPGWIGATGTLITCNVVFGTEYSRKHKAAIFIDAGHTTLENNFITTQKK